MKNKTNISFEMKKELNDKGNELLSFYDEFHSSKSQIVKKAIEVAVKSEVKTLSTYFDKPFSKESRDALVQVLLETSKYVKAEKEYMDDAKVFVLENMDTTGLKVVVKTDGKSKKISVVKKFGVKSPQAISYFGINEAEIAKFYGNGFIETFVDTRLRKLVNDYLASVKAADKVTVTVGKTYKVENRLLFDFDVDFTIKLTDLSTEILDQASDIIWGMPKDFDF